MPRIAPQILTLLPLVFGAPLAADEGKLPPPVKRKIAYEKDVLPLLKKTCYKCHGEEKQEGGLRLDRRESALAGGDSGEVIHRGKSSDSLLIKLLIATDPEESMPPGDDKLSEEQIGILRAWIDQGIDWPDAFAEPGK